MKPKRPKPGFKNFIKTRIKHPFYINDMFVYISESGERFRDKGSVHTVLIPAVITIIWYISFLTLNCTVFDLAVVLLPLIMHWFLRYFWTHFVMLDEQGNEIDNKSLISERNDIDAEEGKHSRYKVWHKALIALEVIFSIGFIVVLCFIFVNSPYSRPLNSQRIEYEKEYVDPPMQDVESLTQAYAIAAQSAEEGSPDSILTDYGVSFHNSGETYYYFIFKNIKPSIIKRTQEFEIMKAWIKHDNNALLYFSYHVYSSPYGKFNAVASPEDNIDAGEIMNIICSQAGIVKNDAEYFKIGTRFYTDLPELPDPGRDTWAVQVGIDDEVHFYTVDIEKGIAILEMKR